jgi:flotillin
MSYITLLLLTAPVLFMARRILSLYAVCQPNQVLVFYGRRRPQQGQDDRQIGYRLIKGGGSLCLPFVESVESMDLGNIIIDLKVNRALSKGGIRLTVEAVANVKVASREPIIHNAVERLLGRSIKEIKDLAQITLESNLRGILAMLTPEEVNSDREAFSRAILEEALDDLHVLGLDLDGVQITNISDDVNYLDSIGRPQQVALLRDSRIAEAEARARSRINEAENEKDTALVRIDRDIAIARVEADRRIQEAITRQTAQVAEAQADIGAIIARVEAELPMQTERIGQMQHQLQADVVAPAEAACQRAVAEARGAAAAILEDGQARADGMRELVRSLLAAGPDAQQIYLLQRLEPLLVSLRSAVPPIEVDQLQVIGQGADGKTSIATLLAEAKAATGLDLGRWLPSANGDGKVNLPLPDGLS